MTGRSAEPCDHAAPRHRRYWAVAPEISDRVRPALDLGLDVARRPLGIQRDRLHALPEQLRLEIRGVQRLRDLRVQSIDDGLRRIRRRHHAVPGLQVEVGEVLLGKRTHVGQRRRRLRRRDAERLELAGLDVRDRRRYVREHHRDLAAEQVGHGCGAALVGHVDHVDAREALEELAGEVLRSARSGRAEAQLAGLRLRQRDEFPDVAYRGDRGFTTSTFFWTTETETGVKSLIASKVIRDP